MSMSVVFPEEIESAITEAEGRALADLARGRTVLELGAWLGCSTVCIAQTAARVVSVDWHRGDEHAGPGRTLTGYIQSLDRYGLADRVITVVARFEDVLPLLADQAFDLVFLDGAHSYEHVRRDIAGMRHALTAGGALAFHDFGVEASPVGRGPFGVTQALLEVFGEPDRVVDTLAIYTGLRPEGSIRGTEK
jgi:predicted O-methyltransferase YrrM